MPRKGKGIQRTSLKGSALPFREVDLNDIMGRFTKLLMSSAMNHLTANGEEFY